MKRILGYLSAIVLVLSSMVVLAPPASALTNPVELMYAYQDQGYNNPCLRTFTGCWRVGLNWDRGNCTNGGPGYRWTRHPLPAYSEFDIFVGGEMSSIKLLPGSGCNSIRLGSASGLWYQACVSGDGRPGTLPGWGINWFGPGFNDNIQEVDAYYLPYCGTQRA